jgi:UDP-N-acetylmuramate--alanine ligase
MNFGEFKRIHFVGVGGIGMSGLAEILTNFDVAISGCDMKRSPTTERLTRSGVVVQIGHDAAHVEESDLVVTSSAVRPDNPEVLRAHEKNIPVMRRAEMLGRVMRAKKSVAVSGTHGKTSTSAMTGIVLREAGLDPTLIIGGVLRNLDTNARLGASDYMVVEADEYDRSFLALDPLVAIVTNIEADHLDCYRDLDDIRATFRQFLERVTADGVVVACVDDPEVRRVVENLPVRVTRYGLSRDADLRASNLKFEERGTSFDLEQNGQPLVRVSLRVPGEHNVRNALAAAGAALALGVDAQTIAHALGEYSGVERRFQLLGEYNGAIIVDDYAHHPSEIRATLAAARSTYPSRRIVALFQPHLYSRTRDFSEDFADALSQADVAWVTPIYPAREEPIDGVTSALITDAAERNGRGNVTALEAMGDEVVTRVRPQLSSHDLFVTMGAGDSHRVAEALAGVTE